MIRSVMERTRSKFQVAIAEVGDNDARRSAVLGVACVSNQRQLAEHIIEAALAFIEETRPDCEVVSRSIDVIPMSD